MKLESFVRDIPDFPKKGIIFKDITPLLKNAAAFTYTIDLLAKQCAAYKPEVIVAVEARGFIFGAAVAHTLKCGFVPVRKPGKLPYTTIAQSYQLEYGTDTLTMHSDAITPGQRVVIVDDVLATGGTLGATAELIRTAQGIVAGSVFVMELSFLNGRAKLNNIPATSLITY